MDNLPLTIVAILSIGGLLAIIWMTGSWAISDAQYRGKSPLVVFIAVIFFFPWGLIAWLAFRPDPPRSTFDLDRFRKQ